MLRSLAIRHFAIIDSLELEFEPGFTAITGETGAGKSILVDALGLLLGERADSSQVAAGFDQAELSARFELADASPASAWLHDQAMAEAGELIIRRIVPTQGSSRAWINGRSATIGQLAELGTLLVEIHGQHEHQQLEKPETQRGLVDQQLADKLPRTVADSFARWQAARLELEEFESQAADLAQVELLRFQCQELDNLAMAEGEYEQLEAEQERLSRSDEVRACVARAGVALDQDEGPAVRSLLLEASDAIDRIRELDPSLATIAGLLDEARINVDETISELERFNTDDEADPQRLVEVNRRLERALDMARKHRVAPGALPELKARLGERLESVDNHAIRQHQLKDQVRAMETQWSEAADALSQARSGAATRLADSVNQRLGELGMDQARISLDLKTDPDMPPARHGRDRIEIRFSANPGQPHKPLAKVASGGELSRVSLALMIAARPRQGPISRVFDEVDAGIGGETAHVVGRFLSQAAGEGQAFCVTHLAQVAACADHQLQVVKERQDSTTRILVRGLNESARQGEIARMLGSADSSRSLAHAREMLDSSRKSRTRIRPKPG